MRMRVASPDNFASCSDRARLKRYDRRPDDLPASRVGPRVHEGGWGVRKFKARLPPHAHVVWRGDVRCEAGPDKARHGPHRLASARSDRYCKLYSVA